MNQVLFSLVTAGVGSLALRYYHHLKPLIPRFIQIEARSWLARHKWKIHEGDWPISEKSSNKPEGWPGWPEGKRFALVLTHDVEGTRGVERCLAVADIEKSYGFRSSYNFVCQDYPVPSEILTKLQNDGFEIGVHGLTHRGNPFRSKNIFLRQVPLINAHLRKFGAVGFRSPCMYHNLEWIGDLDIEYDASTFDFDPFEPQPDGMHTIFPFIVSNNGNGRSYVELSYTLPQDSTVFILLKQRNIDLWKRKLEWIAEKGGMALVITHPDYMNIQGGKIASDEYPAHHYEELLRHIKTSYEGEYYHATPREVVRLRRKQEQDVNVQHVKEGINNVLA